MAKRITCPFCFEIFTLEDIKFRCANVDCTGKEPDIVYSTYQGLSSSERYGYIFEDSARRHRVWERINTSAECPKCDRVTQKRVCPKCHYELMHDVGQTEEHTIAIIGGRSSGKSIYIATLIHRLKNEVGSSFSLSANGMNDFTRERYKNDFHTPLFKQKLLLNPSQRASTDSKIKTPMVFRLTFADNFNKRKAVNLVLFDTAGEDMQSLDSMSAEARYICYADAIIFLIDPLQIDAVREMLDQSALPPYDSGAQPTQIVERLRELHERVLRVSASKKITKPIAFSLSKVDQLFSLIDPSSGLHHSGEHFGYVNLSDIQSIHTEIFNYVNTWMGAEFNNTVKNHFSNYQYFGFSALGSAPIDKNHVNTVSSIRVEDPILWILHEFNVIKGKKG